MLEQELEKFPDDPIKKSRGERGYVFPAFTALSAWSSESLGKPIWKELDIAAFKEALKGLNQFSQKTAEREDELQKLEARFKYMIGESDQWERGKKDSEEDENEAVPVRLAGDARFELASELLKELSDVLNEGRWGITRASLRGYRKIKEKWNALKDGAPQEKYEEVVKDAQRQDPQSIGAAPLFYALCQKKYHDLWKTQPDVAGRAKDLLYALCELNELQADIERKKEPINLTPAEPRHSRRLVDFKAISKLVHSTDAVDVSIAMKDEGVFKERRIRLHYSAPRLHRDELVGGESRWLQPMMKALGLEDERAAKPFDSAVALMPDFDKQGQLRMLLNFPVDIDAAWLQEKIRKSVHWKNQFNGVKEKNIHLHWPGTATPSALKNAWWENAEIQQSGFTVLGIDMGQRMAAAGALVNVTSCEPESSRPVRHVGSDGVQGWYAEIQKSLAIRLPGENAKGKCGKRYKNEGFSKRGRTAHQDEYEAALQIARLLGMDSGPDAAIGWIGKSRKDKSYSQQNSALIRLANRRLSRLGTYHRWSCLPTDNAKRLHAAINEVGSYREHGDWLALLNEERLDEFKEQSGRQFCALREELLAILLRIADRTLPLRGRQWAWHLREDGTPYGELRQTEDGSDSLDTKVRFQGGLSIERIEQLEELRRLFQRYNRSLDRRPEALAKFGKEARAQFSGEPCPDILRKLDHLKQERVNLTAHLILAQALGVRLSSKDGTQSDFVHGAYETISGRKPVDFIVLEDLGKYRTSQRRSPGENARLMNWSHRAVLDKVKMLAEPFGIPVLEISADYSSRFNAKSGIPGFRCVEVGTTESRALGRTKKDCERSDDSTYLAEHPGAPFALTLLGQLKLITEHNQMLLLDRKGDRRAPLTLLVPQIGGPLFLSAKDDNPVQADTNAAANLALRAVAAPHCIDIHRKIRSVRKGDSIRPARLNKREKAAYEVRDVIEIDTPSKKMEAASTPNFFYDPDGIGVFDRAMLKKVEGDEYGVISGIAWHWSIREFEYKRCVEINQRRINNWRDKGVLFGEDDLPM